jgi:hypothetical protein
MAKGYDIDDIPTGNREQKIRPADVVEMYPLGPQYANLRFVGEVYPYGGHWVKVKKRDGSLGSFYAPCASFDPDTGRRDSSKKCAWCNNDHGDQIRFSVDYYSNVIVRKLQKTKPEDAPEPTKAEVKAGSLLKGTETWSPVRVLRMPTSILRGLKEQKELNVHEDAEGNSSAFGVSHAKYGANVMIKKDDKAATAAQTYVIQRGDHAPLKKEERAYMLWDLSNLQALPTSEETEAEYTSWASRNVKGAAGSERKKAEGNAFDDEDETPPPRKKRPAVEDDDEDTPLPKKKKTYEVAIDEDEDDEPPKKKKKPSVEDDDDEEAPPPKRKKPPVDEDDEDEPPRKKKPAKDPFDDEDL